MNAMALVGKATAIVAFCFFGLMAFGIPEAASARALACHGLAGSYVNVDGRLVHRPQCTNRHQPARPRFAATDRTASLAIIAEPARITEGWLSGNQGANSNNGLRP